MPGEFFALALYIPWLLCPALRALPAVAGLAYFHCASHPLWCLRGVVFSELVHSYVVELCLWGLKVTNERQDDGAGILHQVAQFPIDQAY